MKLIAKLAAVAATFASTAAYAAAPDGLCSVCCALGACAGMACC